jgi:hypothetical protein
MFERIGTTLGIDFFIDNISILPLENKLLWKTIIKRTQDISFILVVMKLSELFTL